jgi:uncharacterized phage protein gp47/JayE
MYENLTYEVILARMLAKVSDDVDKREGSVIRDALSPAAFELAKFYSELDNVINETFADTAGRSSLIRRAAERGITPHPATFAVVSGSFNVPVPIGARFSLGELRYRVSEIIGNEVRLICERSGAVGNRPTGDLQAVDFIAGLTSARITGLLFTGADAEGTEQLRQRYFDSFEAQAYGGNIADYRRMVLSIEGVGGVKVDAGWNGGGSVLLTIQSSQWGVVTGALINHVQSIVDPADDSGVGAGRAPIGHRVSTRGVTGVPVNISATFTLAAGWSFADIQPDLERIVEEYLHELRISWSRSDFIVVRASQIEVRLLSAHGVIDIANLRLNDNVTGRNITLGSHDIPVRGAITDV